MVSWRENCGGVLSVNGSICYKPNCLNGAAVWTNTNKLETRTEQDAPLLLLPSDYLFDRQTTEWRFFFLQFDVLWKTSQSAVPFSFSDPQTTLNFLLLHPTIQVFKMSKRRQTPTSIIIITHKRCPNNQWQEKKIYFLWPNHQSETWKVQIFIILSSNLLKTFKFRLIFIVVFCQWCLLLHQRRRGSKH